MHTNEGDYFLYFLGNMILFIKLLYHITILRNLRLKLQKGLF